MPRGRALATLVGLCMAASASASTYTVRRGDNLTHVARRLGVPVAALATANDITDINRVRAGQVLKVPRAEAASGGGGGRATRSAPAGGRRGAGTHTVRRGETLARIARRYGTTVAELARVNDVRRVNRVREGTVLAVPGRSNEPPARMCPVKGATRHDFSDSWGAPRHGGRFHTGNDIFARRGTPVVANVSGTLQPVRGSLTGIGYYLVGDDGTTYFGAHLDTLRVGAGRVGAGAVIGTVGTTGNAKGTPPHLHFEVKPRGGRPVDPNPLLRRLC